MCKSEHFFRVTFQTGIILLLSLLHVGTSLNINKNGTLSNLSVVKINFSDAIHPLDLVEGDIIGPLPKIGRSGIIDPSARWPSNTVVYEFDPNFPAAFRSTFNKAIKHITGRTCVIFKERMAENDYIFVTQGLDCSSSIGNRGNRQVLSLGTQCADLATHIHHLVHVIGFGHEHNRSDRDEYITINYANMDPINRPKFDTYPDAAYSVFSVPYDYGSITHYGPKVMSANGQPTITPKQVGAIIGEANALSDLDIKKINNMYCSGSVGMMIRSVYDDRYLDVKGGITAQGKEVILSKRKYHNEDSQTWTANWVDLGTNRGATFANWAQDGGRLKVLDEDVVTGAIATWGYASGSRNQYWKLIDQNPPTSPGSSSQTNYMIENLASGRCLSAPTAKCAHLNLIEFFFKKLIHNNCKDGHARAVPCDSSNEKQLWKIDFV
ncbi:uncharacterized protein LOC110847288 [Folsomia candida]|uniref:uncharacterized protein LOC110847288 n=1 Tax=Folsomia candida TaxID=158441 RepID=UPI000B8F621B|nr:uncharacterized protein LOC110847288 [Folsomia candida]